MAARWIWKAPRRRPDVDDGADIVEVAVVLRNGELARELTLPVGHDRPDVHPLVREGPLLVGDRLGGGLGLVPTVPGEPLQSTGALGWAVPLIVMGVPAGPDSGDTCSVASRWAG